MKTSVAKPRYGLICVPDMDTITNSYAWVGLIAGVLTTLAFLPQVFRAWRTRSTSDVSLTMFLVLVVGICMWLIYGFLINDIALILANAITLVLASAILIAKLRFK